MRDDRERLLDILDDIQRIHRHLPHSRERFDSDEVIQAALTRWIQNIGEVLPMRASPWEHCPRRR